MSLLVSNRFFPDCKNSNGLYFIGQCFLRGTCTYFLKGELIDLSPEQAIDRVENRGIQALASENGDYFLVCYDHTSCSLQVIIDKIGRECLFYYRRGDHVVLSDDFWKIISLIQPEESDLDVQAIKEYLIFFFPLFNRTFIKDLHFFPPGTWAEFKEGSPPVFHQYWDFAYSRKKYATIDQALQGMDATWAKAMNTIREKNASKTIYGVGLSGGLDSRIVSFLAIRAGLPIRSFILGQSRPFGLLRSNDHVSALRLAERFRIKHQEIEYDSVPVQEKSDFDLFRYPMGGSELVRTPGKCYFPFDVLLNGQSAMLIIRWFDMAGSSFDDFLQVIIDRWSRLRPIQTKHQKVLGLIGMQSQKQPAMKGLKGIFSESELEIALDKLRDFYSANAEKSPAEILQKYAVFHIASKSKYGVFESLQGAKKSYSIYYPFLLEEILQWKPEFIKQRRIIKEYIRRFIREVASIRAQDYKPAICLEGTSKNRLRRILSFADFAVRGKGVVNYIDWLSKKDYRAFAIDVLRRENRWFHSIFDLRELLSLEKGYFVLQENILKVKRVLDTLENRNYLKW